MLNFNKTGKKQTFEHLVEREKYGTTANEAAMQVLAAAVGINTYLNLDNDIRTELVKDIRTALIENHPNLLTATTRQLEQNKLPVDTATTAFITEVRDAILAAKNPQLEAIQASTEAERSSILAKRSKLEKLQENMQNEQIIQLYLGKTEKVPSRASLGNISVEEYGALLQDAAEPLRQGKTNSIALGALGLNDAQKNIVIENVSKALEAVKTHAVSAVESKTSASRGR